MNDEEIVQHLHFLYNERRLCVWCGHPGRRRLRRHLCSSCYDLAHAFRSAPTAATAIAIAFAQNERRTSPANREVSGLDLETILVELAAAAFAWRRDYDNPFWHSANVWSESYSPAQRRLLYHYYSLVTRERGRRMRRSRASAYATELYAQGNRGHIDEYVERARAAVDTIFA